MELPNIIAQAIYDKKGCNIVALDVSEFSSLTDYVIIAEGNVDRHVIAIAKSIQDAAPERAIHVEGMENGDWIVLDFITVIVHIFGPGLRDRFQLEKLWDQGIPLELAMEVEV